MDDHFPLMIPGADSSGELIVTAPFDGKKIATVSCVDSKGVEKALENGHRLFENRDLWLSIPKRLEILDKAATLMEQQADMLATEAAREGGKPLIDSQVEVARAIDGVRLCVETLRTQSGTEIPMRLNASSEGRLAFTRLEPIGLIVAVSAFNHPLNLIVHQVGPAVATGCPVIVKPSMDTPLSCLRFLKILRDAGLPEEWCQVAITEDNNATKLVVDERVRFFSFIGSAKIGWMLRSKLAPGTRCALEHGGAAPAIIASDADLDMALPLLVKGGFYHAGQICVSVQRVFAHNSIARELAERMAKSANALRLGDPTLPETEVGPLIRHREVDRVEEWVNEAVAGGAELLAGGKRISDSMFQCTVLFNPPSEAKVSCLEIFGPVVCIYQYTDIDEAISQANSLPFAFQAAVFTQDINLALRAYKHLNASAVMVNDHTAFRVDWMPFAGLGVSGHGIGGIPYTMRDIQIEKMMVVRSTEL